MSRFLFVLLLLLGGCNQGRVLEELSSSSDQTVAKSYIEKLRAGDIAQIEEDTDPSVKTQALHETLVKMVEMLPKKVPTSSRLVGEHTFKASGAKTVNSTYEYQFDSQWYLISVAVREKEGATSIVGFNVVPQEQSLEVQNRFTLSSKGPTHYAILVTATLAAIFTLYALIVCIRTRVPRRKWLWILFILFGIGKLSINWTTGQWFLTPVAVQLFSASASAALYGPWIVSVSLPVGSLLFLIYRSRLVKRANQGVQGTPAGAGAPDA